MYVEPQGYCIVYISHINHCLQFTLTINMMLMEQNGGNMQLTMVGELQRKSG